MKLIIVLSISVCLLPFVVFFCMKFGTVGYYKAKQFIEKEKPCCESPSKEKCEQCQETGLANPVNH